MRTYTWLVRREFWENRAIWIVPLVIGSALTLASLFGHLDIDIPVTREQSRMMSGTVLFGFGVTFFLVMGLYSSWYLLDCLYADRKDRSVLFWKSLPVSDTETVLAKLFTALVAIPLVYFAAADVTTLLMAFVVSIRAHGTFGGALWQADVWLQLQVLWLYLIFTTAVWYLPFAGWLMLVSAWAKRAVMLWSVVPLLAGVLLERWFFGTHWFGSALVRRGVGFFGVAFKDWGDHHAWVSTLIGDQHVETPRSVLQLIDPLGFLSSADTWSGLVVGILLIVGAIQLRLRRSET